jgi:hypothetical protein
MTRASIAAFPSVAIALPRQRDPERGTHIVASRRQGQYHETLRARWTLTGYGDRSISAFVSLNESGCVAPTAVQVIGALHATAASVPLPGVLSIVHAVPFHRSTSSRPVAEVEVGYPDPVATQLEMLRHAIPENEFAGICADVGVTTIDHV